VSTELIVILIGNAEFRVNRPFIKSIIDIETSRSEYKLKGDEHSAP
jgi:hypothetical protein